MNAEVLTQIVEVSAAGVVALVAYYFGVIRPERELRTDRKR